jgi:hypothetical protein
MEQWWNGIDNEKPKYWEKDLSQSYFAHQKFYTDCPKHEPRPPQ